MEIDDKAIIYLAIGNQIQLYSELLEEGNLDPENRGMAEYILKRSLDIEDKLRRELQQDNPIPRPPWTNQ